MNRKILFITMALLLLSIASGGVAASVFPVHLPGAEQPGKNCSDLIPGSYELKIDADDFGSPSYADGTLTVDIEMPSVELTSNSFDWTSNIPVMGVVVKDGVDGANWYDYRPDDSMGDTNLQTPNNGAKAISHISFCYVPFTPKGELMVKKTAAGSYDRVIEWNLEKSVDLDEHSGFIGGDAGSSIWTVTATKSETLDNFKVEGEIEITNNSNMQVTFSVDDVLDDGTVGVVTCTSYTLAKGESITCTYEAFPADAEALQNIAEVSVESTIPPGYEIHFGVAEAKADITWTENVTGFDSGTLSDPRFSYEELILATTTKTFDENFKCPSDKTLYEEDGVYEFTETNTAYLNDDIDLEDSAEVAITCYAPLLEKTAQGSYDEVHKWDVEKTVEPTKQSAFIDDTVSFDWTVKVTKTVKDENFAVNGTIYVTNPAPMPMTVAIIDYLNGNVSAPATIFASDNCDYTAGSLTVPAGSTAECEYLAEPDDNNAELNTVMATLNSVVFTATAEVAWTANVIDLEVIVDDDKYSEFPKTISEGGTWSYKDSYTCSKYLMDYEDGKNLDNKVDNIAVIKSGDVILNDDTATTVIDCYAPLVKKTAETSLNRIWQWKISKDGKDPLLGGQVKSLTLSAGQLYEVLYGVTVGAIPVDSGWKINGTITVTNPAPMAMTVILKDTLDDGTPVTIDYCETPSQEVVLIDGKLTVDPSSTATCYYSASPSDASATLNTATAMLNEIDFTATAKVDFSQATTSETDKCVDVYDDKGVADEWVKLGTVCVDMHTLPYTFKYTRSVGGYEECGTYQDKNIAKLVTADTKTEKTAEWVIDIDVPCGGCTLTLGYWKTHSIYGPAPYDATWAEIGEDTIFFLSGKTYYQVLWTPPAGNAYYILAPQYVAANLNKLNGASVPREVQTAFEEATILFETYNPAQIAALKGKGGNELRSQFIRLAELLDKYNNGQIGPGHCDF